MNKDDAGLIAFLCFVVMLVTVFISKSINDRAWQDEAFELGYGKYVVDEKSG